MTNETPEPQEATDETPEVKEKDAVELWLDKHPKTTGGIGCLALLIVVGVLAAIFGGSDEPDDKAKQSETSQSDGSEESEPKVDEAALIAEAEEAAKAELPDIPIWKGTTFKGTLISATEVCVDRTFGPKGGVDGNGGNAGYVVVTFPGAKIGDPLDGTCTEPAPEPVDYSGQLEGAFKDELDDSNRDDVERVESVVYNEDVKAIVVTWAINDNLTEGLTKAGAKLDVAKMLEVVQGQMADGLKVKTATFAGTFSLVDQSGNVSEDRVVLARYSGTTIEKIDFDNFLHDDVYDIADSATIHPAFQE